MAVKLRLRRMGNTNRPFYRVVAIDERKRRDGRAIEELGWYDPVKKPAQMHLDEEPLLSWLDRGAQPSETVRELLRDHGVLLKWKLLRSGASPQEATAQVAAHLDKHPAKEARERLSKKARAKAAARAAEAKSETPADDSTEASSQADA